MFSTSQPKQTVNGGPMHSRPICGREMRTDGQRPRWLVVRACPSLARTSINQKIQTRTVLYKKLLATIFLLATPTLRYPYSSSSRSSSCCRLQQVVAPAHIDAVVSARHLVRVPRDRSCDQLENMRRHLKTSQLASRN
jgi:hypothetical protein